MSTVAARPGWAATAQRAGIVAVTGLIVGALAGWVGLWRADGAPAVAAAGAPLFWTLLLLAPAALWLSTAQDAAAHGRASPGARGWLRNGAVGAVGGLLAALLFVVTASQVPAVFAAEDAVQLVQLLRDWVLWRPALTLAAVSALAGVAAAWPRPPAQQGQPPAPPP